MRSAYVIHLLAFSMREHATTLAMDHTVDSQNFLGKLVKKSVSTLIFRAYEISSLAHDRLDDATLGKPKGAALNRISNPRHLSLKPLLRFHHPHHSFRDSASPLPGYWPQFHVRFDSSPAVLRRGQSTSNALGSQPSFRNKTGPETNSIPQDEVLAVLRQQPANVSDLIQLSSALLQLPASSLAVAQLTDAIAYPIKRPFVDENSAVVRIAQSLTHLRRSQLLIDLLKTDRTSYIQTVSFLNIPREDLPNRQDVPLRECDPDPRRPDIVPGEDLVNGLDKDGLVPDCALQDKPMGENFAEAWLLEVTRNIYAEEVGLERNQEKGIRGLLEEMRQYMLSPEGMFSAAQQGALIRTLRRLMTPFLPPFYRIFMGGIVPSYNADDKRVGADPKWLADGVQWVRGKLPVGKEYLEPGRQLGPWFYAPTLTAVVAPYAFGFLVGPSRLNFRSDGQLGGLVVEKCKFLQESNCKGMCLNSCKLPAQELFDELGLPLRVSPNFVTQECQWSFGEMAPPHDEDPTWPKGCVVGCTSREAMGRLRRICE